MKFLWGVLVTVVLVVLVGLLTIYSGIVNVSVLEPPSGLFRWALSTTMEKSVAARADDIQVPELQNEEKIQIGAEHYVSMCEQCHGAPGWVQTELARGLEPKPPLLYQAAEAAEWNAAEMFWITKHGVMMTGMPAWGVTHSDDDIWNIVAFMQRLPELSVDEYNQYSESPEAGHSHSEDSNEHSH